MNLRLIIWIGLALGVAYVATTYWIQGQTIVTQKKQLADSSSALTGLRQRVGSLWMRVNSQKDTIIQQAGQLAEKTKTIEAGKLAAAQARDKINQAVITQKMTNAQLTDAQVKLAAMEQAFRNGDISEKRLKEGLNGLPIFENEAQANRMYLNMVQERNMWRDSTEKVYARIGQLESEKGDLVLELNGEKSRKLAIDDSIVSLRGRLQNRIAKRSKGAIRQLVHKGEIKAMRDVDSQLGNIK